MNRTDFLAARSTGIGGSDIGAILGLNHYRTPYDVFLDKTVPDARPDTAGEAAYWGTTLEAVVAREYQRRTGRKVQRVNHLLRHPEHDFAIANIDRAIINPDISGTVRWKDGRLTTDSLLECKTANSFTATDWGDAGTDSVPDSYLCQCQWYLGVTGCQTAELAVLIGGQDYRIYTIARDPELFANMLEIAGKFWRNCRRGIPPAPSSTDEALKHWPRHVAGKSVIVDVSIREKCDRIASIGDEIAALKAEKDALETDVMIAFGDAEEISCQGNRLATWKTQTAKRLDGKRLKEELPDIAAEYTKTTESRVLRLSKRGKK